MRLFPPLLQRHVPLAACCATLLACLSPAPDRLLPPVPAARDSSPQPPDTGGPETGEAMRTRCVPGTAHLSEVLYDPEGADGRGEREFVEVRAPAHAPLHGYVVEIVDGASGRSVMAVTLLDEADASGYFVIGGSAVPAARGYFASPLPNGPDLARLWSCDGTLLDEVRWGSWTDGSGHGVASARALARCEGATTGWWPAAPTAGVPNDRGFHDGPCEVPQATDDAGRAPELDAGSPATGDRRNDTTAPDAAPGPYEVTCDPRWTAGVRLAELLVDPVGPDTAATEFIEVLVPAHAAGRELGLELWDGASGELVATASFELPAGPGRIVLGSSMAEALPLPFALQNGPDALALVDCSGAVVDGVAWGPGSAGLAAALAVEDAGTVGSGESLARCDDAGPLVRATPSPGSPNAGFHEAGACDAACPEASPTWALIHEVLFDPTGRDGAGEQEFVELLGPPGAPIRGWTLAGIDGGTGARWLGPVVLEGEFDASGLFVLGGAATPWTQLLPGALQNGPDAIVLSRCDGRSGDALAWGTWVGPVAGEGTPAAAPREGSALCRGDDAIDTGNNAVDFVACSPSPGTR